MQQTIVRKSIFDGDRINRLMVDEHAVDDLKFKFRRIIAILILAKDIWPMMIDEATKILNTSFIDPVLQRQVRDGVTSFSLGVNFQLLLMG